MGNKIMAQNSKEIDPNFTPPPTEPRTERYNGKPSKKIDIDKFKIQDGQVIPKRG